MDTLKKGSPKDAIERPFLAAGLGIKVFSIVPVDYTRAVCMIAALERSSLIEVIFP